MNKYSHSFPSFDNSIAKTAYKAISTGQFSGRDIKKKAERQFSKFVNSSQSIITGSGFSALQSALVASGLNNKTEVIIPTITCPSVYHAILSVGAKPVITDVGRDLPLFTTETSNSVFNNKNKVVIVPQMFGLLQDLKPYAKKGFFVIEDAAQLLRPDTDKDADISIFSFSPTKLMTVGYAGVLVSNDSDLIRKVKIFLDCDYKIHCDRTLENNISFRINSSISDFQCNMLIEQLKRYNKVIEYRKALILEYDKQLGFPDRLYNDVPFRYLLKITSENASEIAACLNNANIGAVPLGSHLLHRLFHIDGNFDNAERWYNSLLSLPLNESIGIDDVKIICNKVKKYL